MKTILRYSSGFIGLLILLSIWWLTTDVLSAPNSFAHRFSVEQTLPTFWHLLTQSDLLFHALISLKRILVGLVFALIIGVPIGLLVGSKQWFERLTGPAFHFLRMISPLSIGIAWIVIVPCEMLGVSAGLGYFILDTRDRLAYPELMSTILLIGLIGYVLDITIRSLAHRL